jgi:hypothetical protein
MGIVGRALAEVHPHENAVSSATSSRVGVYLVYMVFSNGMYTVVS